MLSLLIFLANVLFLYDGQLIRYEEGGHIVLELDAGKLCAQRREYLSLSSLVISISEVSHLYLPVLLRGTRRGGDSKLFFGNET